MATKKINDDDLPENGNEIDEFLSDDDLNLMSIVSELETVNNAYVSVYRADNGRSKGAYIFRCSPNEFSLPDILDKLRDEYGGGDFRLVVSKNGAMVRNSPISVEKPRLMPKSFEQSIHQPAAPAPNTDGLNAVLLQMQENARAQADSMRDFMMQQSERTSNMMLEIVKATSNGARSEAPTMVDMLQTMVTLKTLSGEDKKGTDPAELINMFFKGMEQGKELAGNGGDGDESILKTAIKGFAPFLGQVTEQLSNQKQVPQLPAPVPRNRPPQVIPQKSTAPAVQSEPVIETEDDAMLGNFLQTTKMIQQFSPYIQLLSKAAMVNADTEVYANLILDQIEESVIREWIINEENYKKVTSYLPPEINANPEYRGWFDELRVIVIALLDGQDESEDDATSEHNATISDESNADVQQDAE